MGKYKIVNEVKKVNRKLFHFLLGKLRSCIINSLS